MRTEHGNCRPQISVKARLLILFVIMVLPFIAFSIYKAFGIRERLINTHMSENLATAKSIALDVDEYIVATSDLLTPIANSKEVRNQDYEAVDRWFKQIAPKYPFFVNISFIDIKGNMVAAAVDKVENGRKVTINISDTPYFKVASASNDIEAGDFMLSKMTGKPVIHVTCPVFDKTGKRVGFVAAAIKISKIQQQLNYLGAQDYLLVNIMDRKGTVIARSIEPEKWVGRRLNQQTGFKGMNKKAVGTGIVKSSDGSIRVFGFAKAKRVPWYVRVGTDKAYVDRLVRIELINHFAVFIPLLLIAIFGWLWIGRDVDRLHKKAEALSLTDSLTGLGNARKLSQDFDLELSRSKRHKYPLSFAMLDIDHFKLYNDSNGHQLGDKALALVAEIVRSQTRDIDLIYRYGGEELCIILPQADTAQAQKVVERIRQKVEETYFAGEEAQPDRRLTISAGIASYPKDAISKEGLVHSADVALYRAKRSGRNKVELCA